MNVMAYIDALTPDDQARFLSDLVIARRALLKIRQAMERNDDLQEVRFELAQALAPVEVRVVEPLDRARTRDEGVRVANRVRGEKA